MHNYKRFENESDEELIYRITGEKDKIGSWKDVADILNDLLGTEYTESKFRKQRQAFDKMMLANQHKFVNDEVQLEEIKLQMQELKKERQKLSDERLDLNRRLRETSRMETTVEKMEYAINNIGKERYIEYHPVFNESEKSLVVCLSDLHIGASFDSFTGTYNSDIAKNRLNQYVQEIIDLQNIYHAEKCYVVLLGDLISGSIHYTISVSNKENVIDQVKIASSYISDFVYELGKNFNKVEVHSVSGNHSRLCHKKEDALLEERLDSLICWIIKGILNHCENIHVYDQEIDNTTAAFNVYDRFFVGVHGDFDGMNETAVAKLALWLQKTPYCILTGHLHTAAMVDVSGIKVIRSGSLCGSGDEYTREKRLIGDASQTVLLVDKKKGITGVFPITLY